MTRKQMVNFLKRRERAQRRCAALNAEVKDASNGRPHHQACPVGGLFTGMPADASGSDCWCGGTALARKRRQRIEDAAVQRALKRIYAYEEKEGGAPSWKV